eukprot:gb/GFBE01060895.1/.p1 GENE.gb/GFBE01060895.1/~~gb/GFBE01060895.1/.p1  ORF type:complete len:267 (+),score=72.40 gb/GFBE01060895.1/:1-801(+)
MPLVNPGKRTPYTIEEVAAHNNASSLWVIMNRKVYDVTAFHKRHPGGPGVLLQMGGKDATAAAAAAHKNVLPANLMWEFCVGYIVRVKPQEEKPAEAPGKAVGGDAKKQASAAKTSTEVSDVASDVSSVSDAVGPTRKAKAKAKRRSPQAFIDDQENINNRPILASPSKVKKDGHCANQADEVSDSAATNEENVERKSESMPTMKCSTSGDLAEATEVRTVDEHDDSANRNSSIGGSGLFCFMRRVCWGPSADRAPSPHPPQDYSK